MLCSPTHKALRPIEDFLNYLQFTFHYMAPKKTVISLYSAAKFGVVEGFYSAIWLLGLLFTRFV